MILNKLFHYFNKISPVIIQTPWVGAIGNCAEEIYFGLLRARRENKKVFFLFPHDLFWKFKFSKQGKGINRELIKVESPYRYLSHNNILAIIGRWILTIIYCVIRVVVFVVQKLTKRKVHGSYIIPNIGQRALWTPEKSKRFIRDHANSFRWKTQIGSYLLVKIPDYSYKKAKRLRNEIGLPHEAWFVCLHVREGGYYDYKESKHKQIRNADINNYLKAVKFITDKGGWVIRMGDSTMTPLPIMKRVIDYPHTRFKSYLMDIYLIQECRFYIGSQSGIWDVATLFQKPILMPNMGEWLFTYPQREGDLGIIKHIYSRSNKQYLSLQECMDVFLKHQFKLLSDDEHEFHENTPEEILNLVKEYMEQDDNYQLSQMQRKWNERRIVDGYDILENTVQSINPEDDNNTKYRFASRIEGCVGAIGKDFLEKNWKSSSMNKTNN